MERRTFVKALPLTVLPLLPGCGDAPDGKAQDGDAAAEKAPSGSAQAEKVVAKASSAG